MEATVVAGKGVGSCENDNSPRLYPGDGPCTSQSARHPHRLQLAVGIASARSLQLGRETLVPDRHTLLFDGQVVDLRVRDSRGQTPVAHAQIRPEGHRVGFAAHHAFALGADKDVPIAQVNCKVAQSAEPLVPSQLAVKSGHQGPPRDLA